MHAQCQHNDASNEADTLRRQKSTRRKPTKENQKGEAEKAKSDPKSQLIHLTHRASPYST